MQDGTSTAMLDGTPPTIRIESADEFAQSVTKQTTGGHVWDAARVLLTYLQSPAAAEALAGKRIVELGAGTGFLSMHLAAQPDCKIKELVATEMVDGGALEWLERNVQNNRTEVPLSCLRTAAFDWNWIDDEDRQQQQQQEEREHEDKANILGTPWDLIVGSDLVYDEAGVDKLPRVLSALLERGTAGAHVLYAHTLNRFEFADHDFFKELKRAGLACTALWPEGEPQRDDEADGEDDDEGFSGELFPEQRVVIYRICLARGIR